MIPEDDDVSGRRREGGADGVENAGYEVGYGRPPLEHQFKKGAPSPNPRGRPRGAKRAPDLAKVLMEPVTLNKRGRSRKVPFLEALVQVQKGKALNGDHRSTQTVLNLTEKLGLLKPPESGLAPVTVNVHFVKSEAKTRELAEVKEKLAKGRL